MEVSSLTSSVWISYNEEGGFECEQLLPRDESTNASFMSILDDVDNYDDKVELFPNKGRQQKRWKKVLKAMLPFQRQHRGLRQKGVNSNVKEVFASDTSTATASTCSEESHTRLEGLIINTSKLSEEDDGKTIDPNVLDIFSEILDKEKAPNTKRNDLDFDEATACTVRSESSSLSSHSTSFKTEPSLMERRLLNTGLVKRSDFDFVADHVSKEVLFLAEKKEDEYDPTQEKNVSHVKTGIWEITCLEEDGTPQSPYYIVTGVSMEDRVDLKKLRKSLFGSQKHTRRPRLALAPTAIAEGLAGYKSGTMAPICHTQNMTLFLEESLIKDVDLETHKLNVGSGNFGICLSISTKQFLEIAKFNPKGLQICSLIRKPNE